MSFNGDLILPDQGYIVSDISNGTINIATPLQYVNINGITKFNNTIDNMNVNTLKVKNINSFSNLNLDPNDPNQNVNISSYLINIGNMNTIANTNNTINIGNSMSTVNINGVLNFTYFNLTQKTLEIPILELNTAWKDSSDPNIRVGGGAGIVIDSSNGQGYIKTDSSGVNFLIKGPSSNNIGYIATFDLNNNFTVKGKLNVGSITDVETVLNNKVDTSTLNNYYTKSYINDQQFLNKATADTLYAPITSPSVLPTLSVAGISTLVGNVSMLSNLNVGGKTTVNGEIVVSGNAYALGGITSIGINKFNGNLNVSGTTTLQSLSLGSISNVESTINSKADTSSLSSYLTKTDAASTYATISSVSHFNVNGYDLTRLNFNIIGTSCSILGSQWVNGMIGVNETPELTITLPSAFEIINTTFSGLAPIGSCFNTYINYQLGTSRNNIYINTNNTSSITTIYDGYGFSNPIRDSLQIHCQGTYLPSFKGQYSHFITRIDSMTSMSVFKL
jgi:hypothetical protein